MENLKRKDDLEKDRSNAEKVVIFMKSEGFSVGDCEMALAIAFSSVLSLYERDMIRKKVDAIEMMALAMQ